MELAVGRGESAPAGSDSLIQLSLGQISLHTAHRGRRKRDLQFGVDRPFRLTMDEVLSSECQKRIEREE